MKILKKLTSLTLSALAVLIISGFVSLRPISSPIVFASSLGCTDLTVTAGTTTLPTAGNPDSGMISFSKYQDSYKTCIPMAKTERTLSVMVANSVVTPVVTSNFLKGWAWNTNLGEISFYCNGGQNTGINCGNIPYGVTVNTTSGNVRGFAYGQNVGWISMGCDAGKNLANGDCGAVNYGVKAATHDNENGGSCGVLQKGDLYGYAWSSTVGWINFCRGHLELPSPITPVLDTTSITDDQNAPEGGVTTQPAPDGAGAIVNWHGSKVYANGSDSYKLDVTLQQNEGPMDLTDPNVTIVAVWEGTNLRANQIDGATCNIMGENCGAIIPPLIKNGNTFSGELKAIAPTNSTNKVFLQKIIVTIYGETTSYLVNADFPFLPAVSASVYSSDAANAETGAGMNEIFPRTIYISAEKHEGGTPANDALPEDADINVNYTAYKCAADDPNTTTAEIYDFKIKQSQTSSSYISETTIPTGFTPPGVCTENNTPPPVAQEQMSYTNFANGNVVSRFISQSRASDEPIPADEVNSKGVGFSFLVNYTTPSSAPVGARNKTVKYITKTLPDNTITNQAARVSGNVRVDIQKELTSDVVTKSVGQYAQSKRDPYLKAISSLVKSVSPTKVTAEVPSTVNTNVAGLRYFIRDSKTGLCKVIVDKESFAANNTLVGVGCDFYIKSNVFGSPGRLGIIALADTTVPKDNKRKGGNVYICNAVTDLEANIVAEGSLFPYGTSSNNCGDPDSGINPLTGLPDLNVPQSNYKNQLTIVGSIISGNTYGGSFENPPVMGDGTLGDITDPISVATARLYDINFLRYMFTRPANIAAGEDQSDTCWADGVNKSHSIENYDDCNYNSPENQGIVNIIYRAPTKKMPVFGEVR